MILLDKDTKPQETVFYVSAILLSKIKELKVINFGEISNYSDLKKYKQIDDRKIYLALSFLFLIGKIKKEKDEIWYVS